MPPRYVCILDFEATCWNDDSLDRSQSEIIEFPSILFELVDNGQLMRLAEFREYVRPVRHPVLSGFCTQLTGITQDLVSNADTLDMVLPRHGAWLYEHTGGASPSPVCASGTGAVQAGQGSDGGVCFLTCGHWDLRSQLPRELKSKSLRAKSNAYLRYVNIKDDFATFYGVKACGMTDMLRHLGMPLEGRHHSGLDDCRNIARVLERMVADGYTEFRVNAVREPKEANKEPGEQSRRKAATGGKGGGGRR